MNTNDLFMIEMMRVMVKVVYTFNPWPTVPGADIRRCFALNPGFLRKVK